MHSATGNVIKWKKNTYNMHKGYVKNKAYDTKGNQVISLLI